MNNHERHPPINGEIENLYTPFHMYKNHQNQNMENTRARFQNDYDRSIYENGIGNRLIFPGENFMFPFLCKVRHREDQIKPVPGRSLWQRVFKVSEEIFENRNKNNLVMSLNETSKRIVAENENETEQKSVSESTIKNTPHVSDDEQDPIEFDTDGNVKGPFTIIRKEPNKFSTRQDVVNKTLIRSLKKYYTQKFRNESEFYTLRRNKDMQMKDYVDDFADNMIENFRNGKNQI
jgi:hypothetical protein